MDATSTNAQIGTIAIGKSALGALTTGGNNVAIGYEAMLEETTGANNTVVGHQAMNDSLAGLGNNNDTFIGYNSGGGTWLTAASSGNTAVGSGTMIGAMNGAGNNTTVGYNGLGAVTSGDGNTSMGYNSGDTITTGSYNTIIGNSADSGAAGASNRTAIGHEAVGQADNSVTLGNDNVTAVYMSSDSQALVHSAGIQFAGTQVANAGANVLDDYEEGTWTPAVTDGSNIMTAHGDIGGVYTKIGRVVHVSAIILTTGLNGASGDIKVTGLPFTIRNDTDSYGGLAVGNAEGLNISSGYMVHCKLTKNTTEFIWRNSDHAGGMTTLQASEWSDNGEVTISGMYTVE
jgi:hypothetical protein